MSKKDFLSPWAEQMYRDHLQKEYEYQQKIKSLDKQERFFQTTMVACILSLVLASVFGVYKVLLIVLVCVWVWLYIKQVLVFYQNELLQKWEMVFWLFIFMSILLFFGQCIINENLAF